MIGNYLDGGLKMIDLPDLPGSKNTLTQKIMANGRTFLTPFLTLFLTFGGLA